MERLILEGILYQYLLFLNSSSWALGRGRRGVSVDLPRHDGPGESANQLCSTSKARGDIAGERCVKGQCVHGLMLLTCCSRRALGFH